MKRSNHFSKDGNILRPQFPNHHTETSGFEEYGKFVNGEVINPDRLLITFDSVYQTGNPNSDVGFKGHGGREFYAWMTTGEVITLSDLWRLDDRTDESVNCIKLENIFSPFDDINFLFLQMRDDDVNLENTLRFILPRDIRRELAPGTSSIICTKQEALSLLDSLQANNSISCYADYLYREIERSNLPYVVYSHHDIADEDFEILEAVRSGVGIMDRLVSLVPKSRWQVSTSLFQKELDALKLAFANVLIDGESRGSLLMKALDLKRSINDFE